jgi:surfactin synthase thioesterase subunit
MSKTSELATNLWFPKPVSRPHAKIRLFCFPYSGAGASVFYPWVKILPEEIEICPVQYPGRGNRFAEPLYDDLRPLVSALFNAIDPILDKPFAFFGHSLGALIAFELARMIQQVRDVRAVHYIFSSNAAPHLTDDLPRIHHLPDDEFIRRIASLNGTDPEIFRNRELREMIIPVLKADFKICETYQYESLGNLESPITVMGGIQDNDVQREHLEGWRELTVCDFSLRLFPGGHFYINEQQMLLLQIIAKLLL